jgi:cytochrome c peroxidase
MRKKACYQLTSRTEKQYRSTRPAGHIRTFFNASRFSLILSLALVMAGCGKAEEPKQAEFQPEILSIPEQLARYEAMSIPEDNQMSPEKVALGRQLFFDKRLSGDGTLSCYSCHVCENGLTDGRPTAIGAFQQPLTRSSPTLWNIGYHKEFYWDGRSGSLEAQALAAWKGGNMGANPDEIVAKLNAIEGYRTQFQQVFGTDATPETVVKAIAAYERGIIGGDAAWDRYLAGDEAAVTEDAKRGWKIFDEKAKCTNCHSGVLFTDLQYHNVGIGMDKPNPDVGRFTVTKRPEDTGAFKTPTLRDIAKSAPYFHDGRVATLEEAVDGMLGGGINNPHLDRKNLKKVTLTPEERKDLLAFLRALSTNCPPYISAPPLPPDK